MTMRWEGHVECMGQMRNELVQNLVLQPDEGKRLLKM
jgi:hypothetical protein